MAMMGAAHPERLKGVEDAERSRKNEGCCYMDIIFLSENDVKGLLTMDDRIAALDELIKQEALGKVEHHATVELHLPRGAFRIKSGGAYYANSYGFKAYSGGG